MKSFHAKCYSLYTAVFFVLLHFVYAFRRHFRVSAQEIFIFPVEKQNLKKGPRTHFFLPGCKITLPALIFFNTANFNTINIIYIVFIIFFTINFTIKNTLFYTLFNIIYIIFYTLYFIVKTIFFIAFMVKMVYTEFII